jgi:hypothetical protein
MAIVAGVLGAFCLMGCKRISAYDYSPCLNVSVEATRHLTEDASSPFCDFSMDYSYLDAKGDSINQLINEGIQREFLGEKYASLTPHQATEDFKNDYLNDYQKELLEIYQADIARNDSNGIELPPWYNRTFSLVTFIEEGCEKIVGVSANYFIDMGGAHPNQWSQWVNFDAQTGALLKMEDVFDMEKKEEVEKLLQEAVNKLDVALYPDAKITIPNNFLLGKKGVRFLYNRYDIAPRSSGSIEVELSYKAIGHCLKK